MRFGTVASFVMIGLGVGLAVSAVAMPLHFGVLIGGIGVAVAGGISLAVNLWLGNLFDIVGKPQSMGDAMEQAAQNMENAADMMETRSRIARLRSEGDSAKARVVSAERSGKMLANDPVYDFELEVSVGGGSPYRVSHRQLVPGFLVPRLRPGAEFNAWVSRTNPKELALEWV